MTPSKKFFVHHSSFIDDDVTIGDGTKIWYFSHILSNTTIGKNCIIGQNCMIGGNVIIGNQVKIQNNISVYDGVEIEDGVFLGPSMVFTNVINPRAFIEKKDEFKKTLLKEGCSVGANATIVCGITIGRYAFIGAGAVVTKNIPDFALVYGNPGTVQSWVSIAGNRLIFDKEGYAVDNYDSSRYYLDGNIVHLVKE
ncbi:N-acetyltransferase [bacterium]|nr:N-acetyltransferase [bacterium]